MKARIARAVAAALFVLGLLAAGTAPYGDPDTHSVPTITDITSIGL